MCVGTCEQRHSRWPTTALKNNTCEMHQIVSKKNNAQGCISEPSCSAAAGQQALFILHQQEDLRIRVRRTTLDISYVSWPPAPPMVNSARLTCALLALPAWEPQMTPAGQDVPVTCGGMQL